MSTSKERGPSRPQFGAANAAQRSAPDGADSEQAADAATTPRTSSSATARADADFERLHDLVSHALEDMKATDVHEVDVRERSDVTDLLVVASGTSSRHVRSIANQVVREGKKAGLTPLGVEGERDGDWVLVDMGDIVVHVMQPRTREFYGLERLWDVGSIVGTHAAS